MHEYFYGQFNNEYFHEFCFRDVTTDPVSLGLAGSEAEVIQYYSRIGKDEEQLAREAEQERKRLEQEAIYQEQYGI